MWDLPTILVIAIVGLLTVAAAMWHPVRVIVGLALVLAGVALVASMMGAWLGLPVLVIGMGVLAADAAERRHHDRHTPVH